MPRNRPNILVIISDQLAQRAVGAYGGGPHTPNIDRLAGRGLAFETAYTQCPLCMPLRASLWTGRYPHQTTVMSNFGPGRGEVSPDVPTLGEALAGAGYRCAYFGKTHDGGALRGFDVTPEADDPVELPPGWPSSHSAPRDRATARLCSQFLLGGHDRPFAAVASLVNPHDICGFCGDNRGPHQDKPLPIELPPLPPNFETPDLHLRPLPVQYLCCSHRRLANASKWSADNYRHYLGAYCLYVRLMDREVGAILSALDASGASADTLVVFLSDHGEGMAAHRMTTKDATFQEECTRVPLVFAGPGVRRGRDAESLVSLMDIVPTLCDFAGVTRPLGCGGSSLLAQLRDSAPLRRDYVVSEWYTEAGFAGIVTPGRMLRTRRYKYVRWIEGAGEELYDLHADPGETRTLAHDPSAADVLEEHRRLLRGHVERVGDPFFSMKASRPGERHALGYANHDNDGPPAHMAGWPPPVSGA
jgi:choline-sulfatase